MALHPCPRCGMLIPLGLAYCDVCRPIAEQQAREAMARKADQRKRRYNAAYNRRRDPKYLTFYRSKDWRRTSRAKLQTVGYDCEAQLDGCTGLAVEVHHIEPIQTPGGWDRRLDWSNLEAVCPACHNARHPGRWKNKKSPGVIDIKTIKR